MTNTATVVLIVALLIDAAANIARLVAVEVAYKRQAALMARQELEVNRRIEAARDVVADVARAVASESRGEEGR